MVKCRSLLKWKKVKILQNFSDLLLNHKIDRKTLIELVKNLEYDE